MKIKREFSDFQKIILKQLKKQEKLMKEMIREIVSNLEKGSIQTLTESFIFKSILKKEEVQ